MLGTHRVRPGTPTHLVSATVAGSMQTWCGFGTSMRIRFTNTHGANAIELFMTQKAAEAGAGNGVTLVAGATLDVEVEIRAFWTLSANVSSFNALIIGR